MRHPRAKNGFTLIEMMVAILIFGIFISAIYGVYHVAHAALARAEEEEELYQTGRALLAQLSSELASAYPTPKGTTSGFIGEDTAETITERQEDKLTFLTTAHALSDDAPAGDLCQVRYRMDDPDQNETPGLYLEVNRTPGLEMADTTPEPQMLSPLVKSFNVLYLPADGDWEAEWPDGPTMPVAVRIELLLQSAEPNGKMITLTTTVNLAMATAPTTSGDTSGNAEGVNNGSTP